MRLPVGITNVLFLLSVSTQILAVPTSRNLLKAVALPGAIYDPPALRNVATPAKPQLETPEIASIKRNAEAKSEEGLASLIWKRVAAPAPVAVAEQSTTDSILWKTWKKRDTADATFDGVPPDPAEEDREIKERFEFVENEARAESKRDSSVPSLEARTIKVAPGQSSVGIDNGLPTLLALSFIIALVYGMIIMFSSDEE